MRHPRLEIFTLLGELLGWLVGWVRKGFVKLWVFTREKMGKNKKPKVRKSPEGYMGSAPKVHKPRKGKGSYRRKK